eukprot:350426-Chlamydomonas_euryale.AAC.3
MSGQCLRFAPAHRGARPGHAWRQGVHSGTCLVKRHSGSARRRLGGAPSPGGWQDHWQGLGFLAASGRGLAAGTVVEKCGCRLLRSQWERTTSLAAICDRQHSTNLMAPACGRGYMGMGGCW